MEDGDILRSRNWEIKTFFFFLSENVYKFDGEKTFLTFAYGNADRLHAVRSRQKSNDFIRRLLMYYVLISAFLIHQLPFRYCCYSHIILRRWLIFPAAGR